MILVDAECFIAPERRGDFIREVKKIVPVVLREKGCTRYELLAGITGESFHFFEEWASRQHLDEHLTQPHMREYLKKDKSVTVCPDKTEDLRDRLHRIDHDGGVKRWCGRVFLAPYFRVFRSRSRI